MGRLRDYREHVVAGLRLGVPLLRDVQSHAGRFELEDVKRFSLNAPAARVAFVGMKEVYHDSSGRMCGPAHMAIYLVTAGPDSADSILDVVEAVADFINFNQFGEYGLAAAVLDGVENLYSHQVGATGLSLYAVAYSQEILFGRNLFDEDFQPELGWAGDLPGLPIVVDLAQTGQVSETIDPLEP